MPALSPNFIFSIFDNFRIFEKSQRWWIWILSCTVECCFLLAFALRQLWPPPIQPVFGLPYFHLLHLQKKNFPWGTLHISNNRLFLQRLSSPKSVPPFLHFTANNEASKEEVVGWWAQLELLEDVVVSNAAAIDIIDCAWASRVATHCRSTLACRICSNRCCVSCKASNLAVAWDFHPRGAPKLAPDAADCPFNCWPW
jgi:hypothetical protein